MKEVDLIIFDFDGTLVSTGRDLSLAVNYTLNQIGLNEVREADVITFVGDGVQKLLERALGSAYLDFYPAALDIFGKYYHEHLLDNSRLCPGVEETLKNYAHKTKVILTNKRYDFTTAISRGLGIEKYFQEIIGDGTLPYRKPDKRLVEYLLEKYGTDKEKTVIIGDGLNDINLARNSGILCCAYLNGLGKREDLIAAAADYYCESMLAVNSLFC